MIKYIFVAQYLTSRAAVLARRIARQGLVRGQAIAAAPFVLIDRIFGWGL